MRERTPQVDKLATLLLIEDAAGEAERLGLPVVEIPCKCATTWKDYKALAGTPCSETLLLTQRG